MIRKGFKMKLYSDKKEEYIRRHNPIWEELQEVLKSHGVSNYSLFLDNETNVLFGYAELKDEQKWQEIANTTICRKWWSFMADCMETNPDNSPKSSNLEAIFHIN
ncbi:L-rhamnose mutarotase [uncultured Polaribacter sp.]|uniref:L-rhamnose mutarotase n=1 Tax=uncultured Polaribacter sp. TaxID=174711 RepID=UPI0026305444|nr:L-rhamnose mutarotase [uncultured Polaribacter sp.]